MTAPIEDDVDLVDGFGQVVVGPTGREFGMALCDHLGLDPKKVSAYGLRVKFAGRNAMVTVTAQLPFEEFQELVASVGADGGGQE